MVESAADAPLRAEVGQRVQGMLRALSDEIKAMQTSSEVPVGLREGVRVATSDEGALYSFRIDRELTVPPDSEVTVTAPGLGAVDGTLVAAHDSDVLVHLKTQETIRGARLVLAPWKILRQLRRRLKEPALNLPLAASLLGLAPPASTRGTHEPAEALNPEQREAVSRCLERSMHFVWGPPGTGKTLTLAETVRALVERGERVLVVSHANVAVDVAMVRIAAAFDGDAVLTEGRLLRFGTVQNADARPLQPQHFIDPLLQTRIAALEQRRQKIAATLRQKRERRLVDELKALRDELALHRKAVEEAQHRLLSEARVIGTTLARGTLNEAIFRWPADALVVDETGMAPFPAIFALAARAKKRVLLFGDFRQLAPVAQASTPFAREWLHRDAFQIAGVTARIDAGLDEPRVTMLRTQHRMAPSIADAVSRLSYGGRLISADTVKDGALTVVDTSPLDPIACTEAGGRSRLNPVHLTLALHLHTLCGDDTAIVTPYRAQARLLASAIATPADAATIHRFQGSERDVMIVDLVDAPPMSGPGPLTGRDPEVARRLLNVALSRARRRVVVLADVPFILRTHPATSPIRQLVERADIVPGQPLEAVDWRDDLHRAHEAVIHVPSGMAVDIEALRRIPQLTLFADAAVAQALEDIEGADLRLMHPAGGFFAFIDDRVAYVGTPMARLDHPRLVPLLRQLMLGRVLPWGLRGAAVETLLRQIAGRCSTCGEERRPVDTWEGWVLRCPQARHAAVRIEQSMLGPIAEELVCPECKGPGIALGTPPDLWIECQDGDCGGRLPSLEELLG